MEAWGPGLLENERAAELLWELIDLTAFARRKLLLDKVRAALDANGTLDVQTAEEAGAAALLLGARIDRSLAPESARALISELSDPVWDDNQETLKAVARLQDPLGNAWLRGWEEAGEASAALAALQQLEKTLRRGR